MYDLNVVILIFCFTTPLMTAAFNGFLNLAEALIKHRTDASHVDANGWTAEDCARIGGYP